MSGPASPSRSSTRSAAPEQGVVQIAVMIRRLGSRCDGRRAAGRPFGERASLPRALRQRDGSFWLVAMFLPCESL